MKQEAFKFMTYCMTEEGVEYIFRSNSVDGLQDEIDGWYEETQGYTPYESHVIDNTICISDFQFLVYKIYTPRLKWRKYE
jgi:hypothetical protein